MRFISPFPLKDTTHEGDIYLELITWGELIEQGKKEKLKREKKIFLNVRCTWLSVNMTYCALCWCKVIAQFSASVLILIRPSG